MRDLNKSLIFMFLLVLGLFIMNSFSVAAINNCNEGFRVNVTDTEVIDCHDLCKKVTNGCSDDIFVPTNTSGEWDAFRTKHPSCVSLDECNDNPVADFTYSPNNPEVEEIITFDPSGSYDPDGGDIEMYKWDFDNDNIFEKYTVNPITEITHFYDTVGSKDVNLKVKDDEGNWSDIFTKTIQVSDLSVSINSITISDVCPTENTHIDVNCSSDVVADCVEASLEGGSCTPVSWSGTVRTFDCTVGSSTTTTCYSDDNYTATCYVDETEQCTQSGSDETAQVWSLPSNCSDYGNEGVCNADPDCDWCPECNSDNQWNNQVEGSICVDIDGCSYSCSVGHCGAGCDSGSGCGDPYCSASTQTYYHSNTCSLDDCTCSGYTEEVNNAAYCGNCSTITCSDGEVNCGEDCDDGNTDDDCSCLADCSDPYCGDGLVCDSEDCDGANLSGESCVSQSYYSGSLSCNSCDFDTSGCYDNCSLFSVDVNFNEAEPFDVGDSVAINGSIDSGSNCSEASIIQVDANSSDGSCHLEFDSSVADMVGINSSVGIAAGDSSFSGSWTVPSIPSECAGEIVDGYAAALWSQDPNDGGTGHLDEAESVFGSVEFAGAEPDCGNGIVEGDEECDDGNFVGNDACSNSCTYCCRGDALNCSVYNTMQDEYEGTTINYSGIGNCSWKEGCTCLDTNYWLCSWTCWTQEQGEQCPQPPPEIVANPGDCSFSCGPCYTQHESIEPLCICNGTQVDPHTFDNKSACMLQGWVETEPNWRYNWICNGCLFHHSTVTISPHVTPSDEGDIVNISVVNIRGNCSAANTIQVNASGGGCNIKFIGGDMIGINSSVNIDILNTSFTSYWTVPEIPVECAAETVTAQSARLWDGDPGSGNPVGGDSNNVLGSVEFAERICGNGMLEDGEECDDGNTDDDCNCLGNCSLPYCGDDQTCDDEECDDGNLVDGDGCEADCTLTPAECQGPGADCAVLDSTWCDSTGGQCSWEFSCGPAYTDYDCTEFEPTPGNCPMTFCWVDSSYEQACTDASYSNCGQYLEYSCTNAGCNWVDESYCEYQDLNCEFNSPPNCATPSMQTCGQSCEDNPYPNCGQYDNYQWGCTNAGCEYDSSTGNCNEGYVYCSSLSDYSCEIYEQCQLNCVDDPTAFDCSLEDTEFDCENPGCNWVEDGHCEDANPNCESFSNFECDDYEECELVWVEECVNMPGYDCADIDDEGVCMDFSTCEVEYSCQALPGVSDYECNYISLDICDIFPGCGIVYI